MSGLLLFGLGLLLNGVAAAAAFRLRAVDLGGAVLGTLVGSLIFATGGLLFWTVLCAFFLSSSGLSRFRRSEKGYLSTIQEKGDKRDAVQVLANGAAATLSACFFRLTDRTAWAIAFAVAFAAANADTWASEIGVLARRLPISLATFKPVMPGISGGVSLLGSGAAFAGSLFIGLVFSLGNLVVSRIPLSWTISLVITAGGFFGCFVDSLLGATLQAQYKSRASDSLTERRTIGGVPNTRVRGWSFMTNDTVNFLSTTIAAATVALLSLAIKLE
jgi:uncharacterized protein (TIGR00297 family)